MKIRRPPGPHLTRDLYRWAEYHQRQFSKRIMQQKLGALDLGLLNGEKLQAGSDIREFQGFMKALEARETRIHTVKIFTMSRIPAWAIHLGMGGALLSVCWIGGQLWYNGARALKAKRTNSSLGAFCEALCCGRAALMGETDYDAMRGHQTELDDSLDLRRNPIKKGIVWTSGNSDTCEEVGMIATGELEELENDSVN